MEMTKIRDWLILLFSFSVLIIYITSPEVQTIILGLFFRDETTYIHSRLTLISMSWTHLAMALGATFVSSASGVTIGILVTRKKGRTFLPLVQKIGTFFQTLPPTGVIILSFPLLGFGWPPTLLALFLYSFFPVIGSTVLGISSLAPEIRDSSLGLGMNEKNLLWMVEFPLSVPTILTGIRQAFVLNMATAAIGAIIGAGGLGIIIMSGINQQNSALVFSGTLVIVGFTLVGDGILSLIAKNYQPSKGQIP